MKVLAGTEWPDLMGREDTAKSGIFFSFLLKRSKLVLLLMEMEHCCNLSVIKKDIERVYMIIVRGGGDIATGSIYRLYKCGYRVLILETEYPTAIRRRVAFSDAIYKGESSVEGVICRKIQDLSECEKVWDKGEIPMIVDPRGDSIQKLHPDAVLDAILAKKNLGTNRNMAPLTLALGPGFIAGEDVDYVIETMRGHKLARIISQGPAMKNTGTPGVIAGYGKERVIHAPADGVIRLHTDIGDIVEKDQVLAMIGDVPVPATLTGVLRGIIPDGFPVTKGLKIADIDPRKEQQENCDTISDKSRCIAGSVLEVIVSHDIPKR